MENINYQEKYINLIEKITNNITKKKKEINEMKTYFEETDHPDIKKREEDVQTFIEIKEKGQTTLKDLMQVMGKEYAYEAAYNELTERYININ